MSINWVMLSDNQGFVPLPGEQRLYSSPPRTTLSLKSMHPYPGREPYSLDCEAGCVHLTNRRIVYLPVSPSPRFQSFAAPILNLQDAHVNAPWFGPNVWMATVQPVPGGGLPAQHHQLELKFVFKDGGAYDFNTKYERIKERLQQAVEVAIESGLMTGDGVERGTGLGGGALHGINIDAVHLDELPAYDGPSPTSADFLPSDSGIGTSPESLPHSSPTQSTFQPPAEPPPGYEEVQRESVATELERRLNAGRN